MLSTLVGANELGQTLDSKGKSWLKGVLIFTIVTHNFPPRPFAPKLSLSICLFTSFLQCLNSHKFPAFAPIRTQSTIALASSQQNTQMSVTAVEFVAAISEVKNATFSTVFQRVQVHSFVVRCMESVGTSKDHAAQLSELLLDADMVGHYRSFSLQVTHSLANCLSVTA